MMELPLQRKCSSIFNIIVFVKSLSHVQLFMTSLTVACQAPLSSTVSQSSLTFVSVESVMLSNHLSLCHLLLLLPSIFPSIRVFSSKSALHIRWPKFWSFSFSICPSREYSELICSSNGHSKALVAPIQLRWAADGLRSLELDPKEAQCLLVRFWSWIIPMLSSPHRAILRADDTWSWFLISRLTSQPPLPPIPPGSIPERVSVSTVFHSGWMVGMEWWLHNSYIRP